MFPFSFNFHLNMSSFDSFSLEPSVISDIIFALEDQDNTYVFDLINMKCVLESNLDEFEQPYALALPSWTNKDGYSLMALFSRRNKSLSKLIQSSKHGIFKQFKEELKNLNLLNDWYKFKDDYMRKYILKWFNESISDIQSTYFSEYNDLSFSNENVLNYNSNNSFINKFTLLFKCVYKYSAFYEGKLVSYFYYALDEDEKNAYVFDSSFISNVDFIKIQVKRNFASFLLSKGMINTYVFSLVDDSVKISNYKISEEEALGPEYL